MLYPDCFSRKKMPELLVPRGILCSYLGDEHGLELQLVDEHLGYVRGGRARRNCHVDPLLLEGVHDAPGMPEEAGRIPLRPALAVKPETSQPNKEETPNSGSSN